MLKDTKTSIEGEKRSQIMIEHQIKELETVVRETERRLSKITEEMEYRNSRLKRQKKAQKDYSQSIVEKQRKIAEEDSQINAAREGVYRRRELISKKEIALMELTRKNRDETLRIEHDQKSIDDQSLRLAEEETKVHELLKLLLQREQDELPQR